MCFVAFNASIADGYMLETDSDGFISVQICGGGHNDRLARLDLSTGKIIKAANTNDRPDSNDGVCDYASLTSWTSAHQATLRSILKSSRILGVTLPKDVAFIYSTSPPLPARGPPAFLA